ncbi:two-component sensor histidine kinase [Motiliproteus coralliicola]|uniref:histidine kinase n=1 Tax=Motiliproteus coralliicola TaxID=2283196 RepID=A0A369W9Q5_9GAMM|nr:ATP-binding protein [Motiliproteus coralliicola]RDE18738.1 two-component sensor histidine kinase [Motiliproteus coralliicola]
MLRLRIPYSLNARLGLASCLLLPLIIGLTALILDQAYSRSLEQTVRERLELQTYVLLGAAEAGGGVLWMPPSLQEPRFSQPGSGLFGLVSDADGEVLWRSESSLGAELQPLQSKPEPGQALFGVDDMGLFFYSYRVLWEIESGQVTEFVFSTLERPDRFRAALREFRFHLWSGLALLGLLLLAAQALLMRWGLQPLQQMAQDIKSMETGDQNQLEGRYPQEVQPLTHNLNLLLETERGRRQRYRNTLADLAHSLKTPLAVMRNEVETDRSAPTNTELLQQQVDRMEQIINHQLGRAGSASAQKLLQRTQVRPVAERIGLVMAKVYPDNYRSFEVIGEDESFTGDERDLMEMLGNLIDNGFKYGAGRVQVRIETQAQQLLIRIEDDGPGVADELGELILQRGTRADSIAPGQGIGLSVLRDILSSYGGTLTLGRSETLGGASFCLQLPR